MIASLETEVQQLRDENDRLRVENEQLATAVSFTTAALNKGAGSRDE